MTASRFPQGPLPRPRRAAARADRRGRTASSTANCPGSSFNWRVVDEARNPRVPLLERLRFLSISATNLDEFYTVRVAGLRELARAGNTTAGADGLSPGRSTGADRRRRAPPAAGPANHLEQAPQRDGGGRHHHPDPRQTQPPRPDLSGNLLPQSGLPGALAARHRPGPPVPLHPQHRLLPRPATRPDQRPAHLAGAAADPATGARFIALPSTGSNHRFLPLEDLLLLHLGSLFPGYRDRGHCAFRVLRDSDLEVEDEAEDLVREFEVALKRRRRGEVIRMTITAGAPDDLRTLVMRELGVATEEVIEMRGLLGVADLKELVLDAAPRSAMALVHAARAGTGAGPRRRHVRRDPAKGHAAAPPL